MTSLTKSSVDLRSWAIAIVVGRRAGEVTEIRGSRIVSMCTQATHGGHRHCGCARGTVRLFSTNHSKSTTSSKFEAIRRSIGAIPWHEDGDVEVLQ